MEENNENQGEDLGTGGKLKNWLQDNIRIIISMLIVVVIAAGIYSYSSRTDESMPGEEQLALDELGIELEEGSDDEVISEEDVTEENAESQEDVKVAQNGNATEVAENETKETESNDVVREDNEVFVVKAVAGEGLTHMSRKAMLAYLEKNTDSGLTAEHKVYIEDYLQKQAGRGSVGVGAEKSFSKDQIRQAVEKSKQLNQAQLNNLKKYSARVAQFR